jgi:hypothetical protein
MNQARNWRNSFRDEGNVEAGGITDASPVI